MIAQHIPSHRLAVILGALVLLALGGGMLLYEMSLELKPGIALESGKLTNAQTESVHITLDLIQLMMTWCVALLGASGFFLKFNLEKTNSRQIDILLTLAIIVGAVLSIYFGHLAVGRIAELLAVDQFPIKPEVRQLGQYQYISFFSAVLLFGFHVFQFFWPRGSTSSSQGVQEDRP